MVIPESYEPEKFTRPVEKARLETQRDKTETKSTVKKVLTKDELHRIKYAKMFKEVDQLKAIREDIESYRHVILAAHKYTSSRKEKDVVENKEQKGGSSCDYKDSHES